LNLFRRGFGSDAGDDTDEGHGEERRKFVEIGPTF
jgi:hypothetical protein